ncbi:MAG: 3-dehydroquinate synthase, partial [Chthoniobacterales bacterium]
IKHGVICDAPMLHDLRGLNVSFLGERSAPAESSLTTGRFLDGARNDIEALIARSIRIKSAIVAQDDRDLSGQRAILNFGHTIGHALERAAGYHGLMHGEAVSLGMVAACNISVRRAGLAADQRDQVVELLEIFDLPTRLPSEIERAQILDAIKFDKKFEAGRVRFVVTPKLGEAYLSNDVTFDDIRAAIEEL